MKVAKPKRHHYIIEAKPKHDVKAEFHSRAMELTYAEAERYAKELAEASEHLMIRIRETRMVWRNF